MRALKILLPLGVAAHLGFTLWRTDAEAAAGLLDVSPGWLAVAVLLAFTPWLTNTLRLWNWLRWEKLRRPIGDCARIAVASEVGAAVTPTSVGSASVKSAMLAARGIPLERSVSLAAAGSLEDALFFLVAIPPLLAVSGVWHEGLVGRAIGIAGQTFDTPLRTLVAASVGLVLVVVLARTRLGRAVGGIVQRSWKEWRALLRRVWTRRPLAWSTNLLLATVQWAARYSVLTALLHGLGLEVDPVRAFVLQWLCFTVMAIVPTPGAMGGAELLFLALFAGEVPADVLALVMSSWRMLTYYLLSGIGATVLLAGARGTGTTAWNDTRDRKP